MYCTVLHLHVQSVLVKFTGDLRESGDLGGKRGVLSIIPKAMLNLFKNTFVSCGKN